MNAIYNKLKPKRKYTRKPMCENLTGICTFDKCRCGYPMVAQETNAKIDEYLHHREKVIKRKREIELQKLDKENNDLLFVGGINPTIYPSEFAKQKELKAKYKKMIWEVALIFGIMVVSYPLIIVLIDAFNK